MSRELRETQMSIFGMEADPDTTKPRPRLRSTGKKLIHFGLIGLIGCLALVFMISTLVLWVQRGQLDAMDPEYILAASKILEPMNPDADPCEDFYEYVCGKYRDTKFFEVDHHGSWVIAMNHNNSKSIIPRLLNKVVTRKENSCESELKVVQFYHSCMNEFVDLNLSNSDHVSISLTKYSDKDAATSVVNHFRDQFSFDLNFSDGFVNKFIVQWPAPECFVSLFFCIGIRTEFKGYNIIKITPIDLSSIPSYFPVFKNADGSLGLSERGLDRVLSLLFEVSELDNSKKQQIADNVSKTVSQLLKLYAAIYHTSEIKHVFDSSSNGTDYEEWVNFFSEFKGLLPTWATDKSLKIKLYLFDGFFELLNDTEILKVPKNFMELQMISTLHFLLDETNNTYVRLCSSEETVFSKPTSPREIQCLDKTSKYFYINGVLTNAYMKYYMGEESFYTFDRVVQKERETLLELIDKIQIDDTRRSLKEYISKIQVRPALDQLKCQYSDNLLEGSGLTSNTEASFVDKLLSLNKFYQAIHVKSGEVRFESGHFGLNAHYIGSSQRATFLTFIIDSLYSSKNPIPFTYGGIGSIIGHELAHSLGPGPFGTYFVSTDNYTWDLKTHDSYRSFLKCLVDLYNKENINGSISLDENYSDILGLKIAYNAMKNKENMNEIRSRLKDSPILSQFAPEKLLFIYWGQSQCWAYLNEQKMLPFLSSEVHAPPWARVNLVASVFPEFAEEFKCKNEDFMSSGQHCKVWL